MTFERLLTTLIKFEFNYALFDFCYDKNIVNMYIFSYPIYKLPRYVGITFKSNTIHSL